MNMRSRGPDRFHKLCMHRPHSQSDRNGKWPLIYIRRIFIASNAIETTDEMNLHYPLSCIRRDQNVTSKTGVMSLNLLSLMLAS